MSDQEYKAGKTYYVQTNYRLINAGVVKEFRRLSEKHECTIIPLPRKKQAEQSSSDSVANDSSESVVNINTATAEQLQTLDGVGEESALGIIAHRESDAFESAEELIRVGGIGKKILDKNLGLIKV